MSRRTSIQNATLRHKPRGCEVHITKEGAVLETIGFLLFIFAVLFVALFTKPPAKNSQDKGPPADKEGKDAEPRDR